MKSIIVLYHGKCRDGFGAAWSAWKKFKNEATYVGLEHHAPPPAGLKGKELYFLDFSYPKEAMQKIINDNKRVVILDHHVSQEQAIKLSPFHVYDINSSGAVIAWKYFFPSQKVPRLLLYIQDLDLWRFKVPRSREVTLAVELFPYDFKIWSSLARDLENPQKRAAFIKKGETVRIYQESLVKKITERAERVRFEGRDALVVNSPILPSEVGHALVRQGFSVALIWYQKGKRITVSLRSDGRVDVSRIAQKYGGGGHKASAQFVWPAHQSTPWSVV